MMQTMMTRTHFQNFLNQRKHSGKIKRIKPLHWKNFTSRVTKHIQHLLMLKIFLYTGITFKCLIYTLYSIHICFTKTVHLTKCEYIQMNHLTRIFTRTYNIHMYQMHCLKYKRKKKTPINSQYVNSIFLTLNLLATTAFPLATNAGHDQPSVPSNHG